MHRKQAQSSLAIIVPPPSPYGIRAAGARWSFPSAINKSKTLTVLLELRNTGQVVFSGMCPNSVTVGANEVALGDFSQNSRFGCSDHFANRAKLHGPVSMVKIHAFRRERAAAIHAWSTFQSLNKCGHSLSVTLHLCALASATLRLKSLRTLVCLAKLLQGQLSPALRAFPHGEFLFAPALSLLGGR